MHRCPAFFLAMSKMVRKLSNCISIVFIFENTVSIRSQTWWTSPRIQAHILLIHIYSSLSLQGPLSSYYSRIQQHVSAGPTCHHGGKKETISGENPIFSGWPTFILFTHKAACQHGSHLSPKGKERDNIKWKHYLQWKLRNFTTGCWILYIWQHRRGAHVPLDDHQVHPHHPIDQRCHPPRWVVATAITSTTTPPPPTPPSN